MIPGLAAAAGVAWFLALAFVIGGLALRTDCRAVAGVREAPAGSAGFLLAALCALLAGGGLFANKAVELSGGLGAAGLARVAWSTRFGRVWCVEETAILLTVVVLTIAYATRKSPRVAMVPAAAALVARPFASHSAGGDGGLALVFVHAGHLLAVALWLGGLLLLVVLFVLAGGDPVARRYAGTRLAVFSARAPLWVGILAASGLWIGRAHVGSWPALFGTPYGGWLLLKITFFSAALLLAAILRLRVIPAWVGAPARPDSPTDRLLATTRRRLGAELSFAVLALGAAAVLAESVPGAHDTVSWWLPFRFSIRATWHLPYVPERVLGGLALALVALALGGRHLARRSWRRGALGAGLGLAASCALALPALSVPAFPGTYWRSEVPYDVGSVAHGRALFLEHCTGCHGEAGRGDGPLARSLPKLPADLSQLHTADHTAGDLFWWLTHGIPAGDMPGLEDTVPSDERWDLVNYLRAFADGYRARMLSARVAPGLPRIGGIDFDFTTVDGRRGLLRDYRTRSAVMLVLFTPGSSDARMAEIRLSLPKIREHGGEVLAVPVRDADRSVLAALGPLSVIADEAPQIVAVYRLFRRTFESSGNERDDDETEHLELLIDRFGYLRARWRPDLRAEGWNDTFVLLAELGKLASEPEIRPPSDDHVH